MNYRQTEDLKYVMVVLGLLLLAVFSAIAWYYGGIAGQRAAAKEAKPIPFIVEERTKSNAPGVTEDGELCYTTSKDPFIRGICKDLNDAHAKKLASKK